MQPSLPSLFRRFMSDILTTGGTGAIGAVIGALGTFFGLKNKIEAIEKNVDKIAKCVVTIPTCNAKHNGLEVRIDSQEEMLKEIRDDIKTLIKDI